MNFSESQLELLVDLVAEYLETTDDLTQVEWADAMSARDKLEESLEEME